MSSESNTHTPGPWVVMDGQWADHSEDGGGGFHIFMGEYAAKDGIGIISARLLQYGEGFYPEYSSYEEVEANAHLIAAAPDMLTALKAAVEQLKELGFDGLASGADAAILKAEGRTPSKTANPGDVNEQ